MNAVLKNHHKLIMLSTVLLGLNACGGGGDSASSSTNNVWQKGVFAPANQFVRKCSVVRTQTNPITHRPYGDRQGTILDENNWLRSWSNDFYLWYDEIEDKNPAGFSTTKEYFNELKTKGTTPSGKDKDQYHFTSPTDAWLKQSQGGVSSGYGISFSFISFDRPRKIIVAYAEPGSPAAIAGIKRGAKLIEVDGADVLNTTDRADVDVINAGLLPKANGETHQFKFLNSGSTTPQSVSLTSATITLQPVQNVKTIDTDNGKVGYLQFNEHIQTAEPQLIAALNQLKADNISDLVIDLRYNGGGFLYIASGLSYMIAGEEATRGKVFEKIIFNDKYPNTDPFTRERLTPTPFYKQTSGLFSAAGLPLPTLNLSRVFVLTGSGTCSASESIMNSLRGVDVEVIQIGETSCGKPYGFYSTDNCGTTYFSINFKGINDKGFGDYADGFTPANSPVVEGVSTPGCMVADDFTHKLGDPNEKRLAAALSYRVGGVCPEVSSGPVLKGAAKATSVIDKKLRDLFQKPQWKENKILKKPL